MTDPRMLAGVLLLVGPAVGGIPVGHPALLRIWSMSPVEHAAAVRAHTRAWAALNGGFMLATLATSAGLAILPVALGVAGGAAAALSSVSVGYAVGGALWCAVLAIRTLTTPALADLDAAGVQAGPAEALLAASTGGLFAAFVVITGVSLATLGVVLCLTGVVALPVAVAPLLVGVGAIAVQVASGDLIPALLYLPTMLVGISLLAGWT